MADLNPVYYEPKPMGPPSHGLFQAVTWVQDGGTARFLASGVEIKPINIPSPDQVDVWSEAWNAVAADIVESKGGDRPEAFRGQFSLVTLFAYDHSPCAHRLMDEVRSEVRGRAQWLLERYRQRQVAAHISSDLSAVETAVTATADLVSAVSSVESILYTDGLEVDDVVLFAPPELAAYLVKEDMLKDGHSPLGYRWVFESGLGLLDSSDQPTILATTTLYGWRNDPEVHDHISYTTNDYFAFAEQSFVIGWERSVASVQLLNSP